MHNVATVTVANLYLRKNLVDCVSSAAPGVVEYLGAPPEVPARLYGRHDLARLFVKHADTIHRWEQDGWLCATRKASGRILGYPAEQVASVAARLFARFQNATYDEIEAEKLGLREILAWVKNAVQNRQLLPADERESPLIALAYAVFANEPKVAGPGVTSEDLAEHRQEACRQLLDRLKHPVARILFYKVWRQTGVIAKVSASVPQELTRQ